MALAIVQRTSAVIGTASVALTFGSARTAGNVVVVPVIAYRNGDAFGISVTDSSGNTYNLDADSGDSNGARAFIFVAHNVAGGGTGVTVTATGAGAATTQIEARAIEASGFGTDNPLVGAGTAKGNSSTSSATTAVTGVSADLLLVGCFASLRLNFNITFITVNAAVPAWTEEYEKLSSSPFDLVGEADTRIITGDPGAQAISWTRDAGPNWGACIVALASINPPAAARFTQIAREVAELEATAGARFTQIAREIAYPFTCSNNAPTPSPTGCPDQTTLAPVTPPNGCNDDLPV